jgi:hypothetical protein
MHDHLGQIVYIKTAETMTGCHYDMFNYVEETETHFFLHYNEPEHVPSVTTTVLNKQYVTSVKYAR